MSILTRRDREFATGFAQIENPLSDGDRWSGGLTVGTAWSDPAVVASAATGTGTLCCGTQTGPVGPPYNDSIAVLNGVWSPNHQIAAVIFTQNQQSGAGNNQEVEVFPRMRIAVVGGVPVASGYECIVRCTSDGSQYANITRWNGPADSFLTLANVAVVPAIHTGDLLLASAVGSVISMYHRPFNSATLSLLVSYNYLTGGDGTLNGQPDSVYFTTGAPGIGFWHRGAGLNSDFGFTSIVARNLP